MKKPRKHPLFALIRRTARSVFLIHTVYGTENVIKGAPAICICNHLGAYAPIAMALYFPYQARPWVIYHMMTKGLIRTYLKNEFFRKELRWPDMISGIIAWIIAPLCIGIIKAEEAIPVYQGQMRIRETFEISVAVLREGENILIYPEDNEKNDNGIKAFYAGFLHLGRLFYQETGKTVDFYPVYVDKDKRRIIIGKPDRIISSRAYARERERLLQYLTDTMRQLSQYHKSA